MEPSYHTTDEAYIHRTYNKKSANSIPGMPSGPFILLFSSHIVKEKNV
jgi:hypothetical protein